MVSIFLLIILFFGSDGVPKVDVEAFHTMATCQAAAKTATTYLLQQNIPKASITCSEHKSGDLA